MWKVEWKKGVREEEYEYKGRAGEGHGKITLKPLISHRQTTSLCQGVSQSEGQGLGVPSQARLRRHRRASGSAPIVG